MGFLKNILSIIGAIFLIGAIYGYSKYDIGTKLDQVSKLDPKAMSLYMAMFEKVLATGDSAQGMVRKVKIADDVETADVIDAIKSVAGEENLLVVNSSLTSNGKDGARYIRLMSFCNPRIAKIMANYSIAYTAFMPCRIAIVSDDEGNRWLMTMDMDMMLHGGKTLPPELLKEAMKVKTAMYKMMDLGAQGDF